MTSVLVQFLFKVQFLVIGASSIITRDPYIKIPQGAILGEIGITPSDREFFKFWCIPYGKHERFEPSEPADSWKGVFIARRCPRRCPQATIGGLDMEDAFGIQKSENEDCLILNVFTPATSEKLLPVMFYIHGGYFAITSGLDYSGELFLDEDIVLVTINYRLGALGFLSSGDGAIDSNLGLKDMVLALEWVQGNIQYFGGDPDRVTIFGESAGGAAVGLLILSPMATGLFQQAIAQSGSSLIPCAYQVTPAETFVAFAAELNCSGDTSEETVACLKTKDIDDISEAVSKTVWYVKRSYPLYPAIESGANLPKKSRVFLPEHPRKMLQEGNFNRVPLIIGVMEDEGGMIAGMAVLDDEIMEDFNTKWLTSAVYAIALDDRNISAPNMRKGLRKMREFYFGYDEIDRSANKTQMMLDLISDGWFIASMDVTIRYHSKYAPVYPYIFTKKGGMAIAEGLLGKILKRRIVSHAEDLPYQFLKGFASNEREKLFSKRFNKLWTSFAYNGKPTETWGSVQVWQPAAVDTWDYEFYILDDDTSVAVNPFKARVQFRNELDEHEWKEY